MVATSQPIQDGSVMAPTPLEYMSLREISTQIANGTLSCREYIQHCLDRIEVLDTKHHAWVNVYAADALKAGEAADLARASGHAIGPLHGIPIGVKDIIDIEGRVTTGGSPAWAERKSPATAQLVDQLVAAGMVVLGKTHSVEFAMGGWGTNQGMGTPYNPWDASAHRAPGGSSSGSGVAVAAGMVPCAIGTDTGGSVRLPSVWNGLSGLKTTIGHVSCEGVLPLSHTLDTPGPMCRTVEDAGLLFDVLRGRTSANWTSHLGAAPRDIRGMTFGRLGGDDLALASNEMIAAFNTATAQLERLGATIVDVDLGISADEMGVLVGQIIGIEGYSWVGDLVDDPNSPVDPDIRPRIHVGKGRTAREYMELLRRRAELQADVNRRTQHLDGVLCPGTTSGAPLVADIDQNTSPATYTRYVNYMDWCALVVPCGFDDNSMPLALQIACPGGEEATALRIGSAYQGATDWHTHHPQLG